MTNYWQGERLRLRALEEKDLQRYQEERLKPDSIRQWYEDELLFPLSEQDIKKDYEKTLKEYSKHDKRIFIIEDLEETYMGEISIWFTVRKTGVFRYGIFLAEAFRGKGLAGEALIIVLDYYFNELNYHKASPIVYGFNRNSQAFHQKMGFQLEGTIRSELYSRGGYHDLLYYGMLKEEFNRLHKHHFM